VCRGLGGLRVGFARLRMRRRRTLKMEGGGVKAGLGRTGFMFSKLCVLFKIISIHYKKFNTHAKLSIAL